MQRSTETGAITAPIPDNRELRTGALRSLFRRSAIEWSEFEVN
jgi:hypothetical protein